MPITIGSPRGEAGVDSLYNTEEKVAAKYGVTPPRPPRGKDIFWLRVYVPAYRAVPWPVRSAIMRRMPGSHRQTWTRTQRR